MGPWASEELLGEFDKKNKVTIKGRKASRKEWEDYRKQRREVNRKVRHAKGEAVK